MELYAPTKINKAVFDDWLRVTDPNDNELISKLTKTIHKKDNIKRDAVTFTIEEDEQEEMAIPKPPIKGTGTRTKFTCAQCGLNVWAKPTANIFCGDCDVKLEIY